MVQNWHSGAANFDIATKFLLGSKLFGEGPSATLHYTYASEQYPIQIGNRFAVTAAHCLFDESKEEVLTSCFFGPVSKLKHQVTLVEFVKSLLAVRCKILYSFVRLCLPVSSPSCLASTTGEIWKSQTGSNLLSVFHDFCCQENNKGKQGHSPQGI